ncbi:DNA-3-methyladenine glycosylase [Verrucomicrobia bacterium LW23]|nr:DNA-3-methyladenine glycosylase [Verrucomicrobia bacterium LW23]
MPGGGAVVMSRANAKVLAPLPRRLPAEAFSQPDPVIAARYFIGKTLFVRDLSSATRSITAGVITEAEAYGGAEDRACHGFNNRRTPRTEVMFGPGGAAYVYLCYGIHWMMNIVTGPANSPMAVLIRAVEVTQGADLVAARRPGVPRRHWSSGPGKVAMAMAISNAHNGSDLRDGSDIWLEDHGHVAEDQHVSIGPRVGVESAGEWALKPWRFLWKPPVPPELGHP